MSAEWIDNVTDVGIFGLGYVGLPLALLCAEKGLTVIGIDTDEERVQGLLNGKSYISGISDERIKNAIDSKTLLVTTVSREAVNCQVVLICVPTPLSEEGKPDYKYLFKAISSVADLAAKKQLIIVESTIAPGTMENLLLPLLKNRGKVGEDYYFVFSPERADPGNETYRLENTVKLLAGVTETCTNRGQNFYRLLGGSAYFYS